MKIHQPIRLVFLEFARNHRTVCFGGPCWCEWAPTRAQTTAVHKRRALKQVLHDARRTRPTRVVPKCIVFGMRQERLAAADTPWAYPIRCGCTMHWPRTTMQMRTTHGLTTNTWWHSTCKHLRIRGGGHGRCPRASYSLDGSCQPSRSTRCLPRARQALSSLLLFEPDNMRQRQWIGPRCRRVSVTTRRTSRIELRSRAPKPRCFG